MANAASWDLVLHYFPDDAPLAQIRGVMDCALELINEGWCDAAVWLLTEYLDEVSYEIYL